MNILSVDTSTETMGLCLAMGNEDNTFERYDSRSISNGSRHSESLVPTILGMCRSNGIPLKDLDLLVCTNGPGSFTGLRIGMSACKGIALAADIPMVSVSTMEALYACVGFFCGAVVPAIDARKNRFYSAVFADGKRQTPDLDCNGDEIGKLLEGYPAALVTGPDARRFSQQITGYSGTVSVNEYPSTNIALALVRLGLAKFNECGPDDIGTGPTYVRKSDAELALQEKIRKREKSDG
jgi:tRNA threonylcarbamoyladenosine biosynthesis protein TsaB